MKKFYKSFICKIGLVFAMALMFGVLGHTNVYAATIGQQLTSPEAGWQRIDDTDSKI
ncbi:hypothetical protein [Clostridium sp. OS1-26]|uniref:hypothetical protein n=1 Tax=Clostridium sp. OS1-26 TaxID=3070681 RepID=UPI0027DF9932|nr:hypothetical protein [Clostridium sp. OS1-26]WML33215.1 hypothetical protein RCG18_17915 [Clostridium sp. OS1-26]